MKTFKSPYTQYAKFNGQSCRILRKLTDKENPDKQYVGIIYLIEFNSGIQIEALPEELHDIIQK